MSELRNHRGDRFVPRTTEKLPKAADPITTWLSGRRTVSANLLKPE
ncbi:MAG: hypothetical protein QOD97_3191, partial [Mycobacterium sp.]|nr:hypothetical protein [Mycobacterium sp.]